MYIYRYALLLKYIYICIYIINKVVIYCNKKALLYVYELNGNFPKKMQKKTKKNTAKFSKSWDWLPLQRLFTNCKQFAAIVTNVKQHSIRFIFYIIYMGNIIFIFLFFIITIITILYSIRIYLLTSFFKNKSSECDCYCF